MDNIHNNVVNRIELPQNIQPMFYTIDDVVKMTGWSKRTVQELFNDDTFPYADIGKKKVVLNFALIEYFSVRRNKKNSMSRRNRKGANKYVARK